MTTFDLNFAADHFTLFGLPHVQALDLESLDNAFRAVQSQVHPDKHAHAAESDRRLAMQWATRINEAYQTLKSPGRRARYLLPAGPRSADRKQHGDAGGIPGEPDGIARGRREARSGGRRGRRWIRFASVCWARSRRNTSGWRD
jgi:curved DNA-binding protein CbpA